MQYTGLAVNPVTRGHFGVYGEQAPSVLSSLAKTRRDNAPMRDRREVEASVWQDVSFAVQKEIDRQLSWYLYLPAEGEETGPLLPPLTSAFW